MWQNMSLSMLLYTLILSLIEDYEYLENEGLTLYMYLFIQITNKKFILNKNSHKHIF